MPFPRNFTYQEYVEKANAVMEGEKDVKECGVHRLWILHDLPYAEFIFKTKDIMHSANNIIKDSIKLFKPSHYHTSNINRTKQPRVITN